MTPVRLEPAAPQSRVKHSNTEPLRSHVGYRGYDITIDNPYFEQMVSQIYPTELQLKKAISSDTEGPLFGLGLVHYLWHSFILNGTNLILKNS